MSKLKEVKSFLSKGVKKLKEKIDSIPDDRIEKFENNVKNEAISLFESAKRGMNSISKKISNLSDSGNDKVEKKKNVRATVKKTVLKKKIKE